MAFVKPQNSDNLIEAMKKEGATGATIIPARGTGVHEAKTFFGLSIEEKTDTLISLVEEHMVEKLLGVIKDAGKLEEAGNGVAFVLPIEQAVGLESQMQKFKDQIRDEYL
ncbi:MAG: P-II family nitrogen regulator [Cyclobacteriaceae bacterium]